MIETPTYRQPRFTALLSVPLICVVNRGFTVLCFIHVFGILITLTTILFRRSQKIQTVDAYNVNCSTDRLIYCHYHFLYGAQGTVWKGYSSKEFIFLLLQGLIGGCP